MERRVLVPVSVAGLVVIVHLWGCGTTSSPPEVPGSTRKAVPVGTHVVLLCRDDAGRPLRPSSAEVLFRAWGIVERFPLGIDGDRVLVPLDISWLRGRIDLDPERISPTGFLYLKADGFVPIRSEGFPWVGARNDETGGKPARSVDVGFHGGRFVRLGEGEADELEVSFRRPRPRFLKLVERDGSPVAGLEVACSMFWSHENHCGVLSGYERLGSSMSDAEGRLAVPDIDGEYAFEIPNGRQVFESVTVLSPNTLVARLPVEELMVTVQTQRTFRLAMFVTRAGNPVVGLNLMGEIRGAGCGANTGIAATTGEDGWIRAEEFEAEEFGRIWFEDSAGKHLWRADPLDLLDQQPVLVDLPDGD